MMDVMVEVDVMVKSIVITGDMHPLPRLHDSSQPPESQETRNA